LNFIDREGENMIDVDEFLTAIRGKPNARRQAIIDKAFLKFDKEGNGYVDVADLKGSFDCSKHPKVISGELGQDLVFTYFLKNFNDFNGAGKIARKEWNDFYSAVSYSVDNDDNFVLLLKTNWNLE
jgi:Ca2+-binding EF-hand superfamily protein